MTAISTHRRFLALVAALLLAALATAALLSYVKGVERRTLQGADHVSILVARETIPAGTTAEAAGARGWVAREAVPRRLVAEGAVTSLSDLRGLVAVTAIQRGEQIVAGRFASLATLTGVLPIPADRQAIAVEVDVPPAAGGFVQPGSRVSIIAKFDVQQFGQGRQVAVARYLLQDVPVLAVGPRVVAVPGAPAGSGSGDKEQNDTTQARTTVLLTLAVTPSDAEKLTLAILEGEIWFTLLPPGQKPVSTTGRTIDNEFK